MSIQGKNITFYANSDMVTQLNKLCEQNKCTYGDIIRSLWSQVKFEEAEEVAEKAEKELEEVNEA